MTGLELKRHRAVEILSSVRDLLKNLSEDNLYDCEQPDLKEVQTAAHYLNDLGLGADAIQFAQAMNELCLKHWIDIVADSDVNAWQLRKKIGLPKQDKIGTELRLTAFFGTVARINEHLDKILKCLNVNSKVETWRVVGLAPQLETLFEQIEKYGIDEGDWIAIQAFNLKGAIERAESKRPDEGSEPAQILRSHQKAHGKHIAKWLDTSTRGIIRLRKKPNPTTQKPHKNTAKAP